MTYEQLEQAIASLVADAVNDIIAMDNAIDLIKDYGPIETGQMLGACLDHAINQ